MADVDQLDVLRFVDVPVERKSAWGPGEYASRQLEVNGELLADYLARVTGQPMEVSTPIVVGRSGTITPAAYLRALLGGPKDDVLAEGRIAIAYCDACLDGSCGKLLAATLSAFDQIVTWSSIGFEQFDEGEAPKLSPFWKKSAPEPVAAAGWQPAPFEPAVNLRFDRAQYLEVLQHERSLLGPHQ